MTDLVLPYTEALVLQQVEYVLNDTANEFWSEAEINSWTREACADISSKTECYESNQVITLITGNGSYTDFTGGLGSDGIAKVNDIYGAVYVDADGQSYALQKVHPRIYNRVMYNTADYPQYFHLFNNRIFIYPSPSATVNSDLVTFYCSVMTYEIANIHQRYQPLIIDYVLYKARLKERKNTIAMHHYTVYLNGLQSSRKQFEIQETEPIDDYKIKNNQSQQYMA